MRQVSHLQELYRDPRSTEHKILTLNWTVSSVCVLHAVCWYNSSSSTVWLQTFQVTMLSESCAASNATPTRTFTHISADIHSINRC